VLRPTEPRHPPAGANGHLQKSPLATVDSTVCSSTHGKLKEIEDILIINKTELQTIQVMFSFFREVSRIKLKTNNM
jgi:hypothetical protein